MKLRAARCLCLAVVLSGGLMLGQQASPPQQALPEKKDTAPLPKHKIGPFEISINWRTRAEGWNWFEGKTGNSDYPLWQSLLRIGIGQTRERLDWFAELEQPSLLGLPNDAVVAAPQGQLGLGGSYYASNFNQTNNASVFLKQAYVDFKHLGPTRLKLGRFNMYGCRVGREICQRFIRSLILWC